MAISYQIYSNTGVGDPINYSSPIDTTSGLTYTTGALAYPGTWSFGVRAFYTGDGVEEMNVDAIVTIVLSATGVDISNQPPSPVGLRAFATQNGGVRVEWTEPPTSAAKTPTEFLVYTGIGTPNYATPAATVLFSSGLNNSFVANLVGFANNTTYVIGVRASNATATEQNLNVVSVTAITEGPSAVVDLVGTATS
jgi:hypothetical protein